MGEFVERPIYAQLSRIGKALSSPVRLRLLDLLDRGERTVEQISDEAGIALKNTSAQLQQLRNAHVVTTRRDGAHVYYRLADRRVTEFLGHFQALAYHQLSDLRSAVAEHVGDPAELRPVTPDELQARLDDPGILVLDVRSPEDFARGHLPGAVSLPMAELRGKLDEFPSGVEIVAYCDGPYCVLSPNAVRLLREQGHDARPLDGGLTRWDRAGHSLSTD